MILGNHEEKTVWNLLEKGNAVLRKQSINAKKRGFKSCYKDKGKRNMKKVGVFQIPSDENQW